MEPLVLTVNGHRQGAVRVEIASEIVDGRASITPETALWLELALGASTESWTRPQVVVDLWRVAHEREETCAYPPPILSTQIASHGARSDKPVQAMAKTQRRRSGNRRQLTNQVAHEIRRKKKKFRVYDLYAPGMYLLVPPRGVKAFAMDYTHNGKRKSFVLGNLDDIEADEARALFRGARRLVDAGIDPVEERRRRRREASQTEMPLFSLAIERWLETREPSDDPAEQQALRRCVDQDLLPKLGHIPLATMTSSALAGVLRAIHHRGNKDLANMARDWITAIFRVARMDGLTQNVCDRDLVALRLPRARYPLLHITSRISPLQGNRHATELEP